jgi:hypothetical protein
MLQTTLICGLGLLVFALSDFVPASRFAYLMFILLWAALAGDLILLPAVLAGPVGRIFDPPAARRERQQREHREEQEEPAETGNVQGAARSR